MNKWVAKWIGEYPNLCCGGWVLYKNGKEINTNIPFQYEPAGTFGKYCHNYFDEEYWTDRIEYYYDGIGCKKWINKYQVWLKTIAPKNEWRYIYKAFKEQDWRYESCGGCV